MTEPAKKKKRKVNPPRSVVLKRKARKKAFLAALSVTGNITEACKISGVPRKTHDAWKAQSPKFKAAFERAMLAAIDFLETEAKKRAIEGWQEPVIHQGRQQYLRDPRTGELILDDNFEAIPLTVTKRSDRILEVMLKAKHPDYKTKSKAVSITANGGDGQTPVPQSITINFSASDGNGHLAEPPKTDTGTTSETEEAF